MHRRKNIEKLQFTDLGEMDQRTGVGYGYEVFSKPH